MCRIFGFRSVIQSQVHTSLVSADNALMAQSENHPDGWGVAYYTGGAPHVVKSVQTAVDDHLFRRVSGVVTSETVVAHLRKATHGDLSILNTHPFQYGQWIFVHNGNIAGFELLAAELRNRIPAVLRRFILGDTDSEVLFYLILGHMARRYGLERAGYPLADAIESARDAVAEVLELAGDLCSDEDGPSSANYLTFVLTNGRVMIGFQGGKPLYVSTHKNQCSVRDQCASYAPECERRTDAGFVSHLIFSSEPLSGENVWDRMKTGDVAGVDWRMQLTRGSLSP